MKKLLVILAITVIYSWTVYGMPLLAEPPADPSADPQHELQIRSVETYIARFQATIQRIDHFTNLFPRRLRRLLGKTSDGSRSNPDAMARANALLEKTEHRLITTTQALRKSVDMLESDRTLKTDMQKQLDNIAAKITGVGQESRNHLGSMGIIQTEAPRLALASLEGLPAEPIEQISEPVAVTVPDVKDLREWGEATSHQIEGDGALLSDYAQKAFERLEAMVTGVNDKAEATIARIKHSDLLAEEQDRLIGKVQAVRTVAVTRIEDLKRQIFSGDVPPATEAGEARHQVQREQSDAHKAAVIEVVQEKQEAEQQTTLVPGTGGTPLSEQFDHHAQETSP